MDGSDRKSVSSSSSTPLIEPKPSASDENNQSYHQKAATKHFMSPTISAASKAIAPRRKVLAEKNEISDTLGERTPNVDLKGTFSRVDVDKSDDSLSVNSESSLRSYDLPRSKFRRYKPNRGREIILQYENEVKGKKERLSSDEEIDMVSACQEGFVKEESEEVDEREEGVEEEEEEEEEREGFWRKVLKLLLVLVVLVVSTLYISSANSPTTLKAMESVKEGCVKIHEGFVSTMNFKEIVKFLEGGNEYLDGSVGLMKINKTVVYEGIEEVEEMVEDVYLGKLEEISHNLIEIKVQDEKGSEEEEEMVEDVYVGNLSEVVEVEPLGGDESEAEVEDKDEKRIGGGDLGEIVELELLQGNQIPIVTSALPCENEAVMEPLEENDLGEQGLEMVVESEMAKAENVMDIAEDDLQEGLIEEGLEMVESEMAKAENVIDMAEDDLQEGLIEDDLQAENGAVVGVALFFVVVTSLVLAFYLKRKRNDKKDDQSLVLKSSCSNEYALEDKCCSPIVPNEREDHIKHVDSAASPPISLINSSLMDFKELSQTRAPSIELLGEFVVGEMTSRSFRSSGMKSLEIESEVSSHSISLDNNKGFPTMNFSEASAMHSQVYGYFTPEKKVSKKEEGIDGEAKKVVTTPLRRSSRLRNRAVQSP